MAEPADAPRSTPRSAAATRASAGAANGANGSALAAQSRRRAGANVNGRAGAVERKALVVISPFVPTKSGLADYAAQLLPYHADAYDCVLVIDDIDPEPDQALLPASCEVMRASAYAASGGLPDALHVYHVGNNVNCAYMLELMPRFPGVAMVHDLSLLYMLECYGRRLGDMDLGYVRNLGAAYGADGAVLGEKFLKYGWRPVSTFFDVRLLKLLSRHCFGFISHSKNGAISLTALTRDPDLVVEIPHFARVPTVPVRRPEHRRLMSARFRFPIDAFVVGMLGFFTATKQPLSALRALKRLADTGQNPILFVVGEMHESEFGERIEQMNLRSRIVTTGWVDDDTFDRCIDACDVILSLRYPTMFEASGVVCRALGRGALCVTPDQGWYGELPNEIAAKAPYGVDDRRLAGLLTLLRKNPDIRLAYRRNSLTYARQALRPDRCADAYHAFFERAFEEIPAAREAVDEARRRSGAAAFEPWEDPLTGARAVLELSVGDDLLSSDLGDRSASLPDFAEETAEALLAAAGPGALDSVAIRLEDGAACRRLGAALEALTERLSAEATLILIVGDPDARVSAVGSKLIVATPALDGLIQDLRAHGFHVDDSHLRAPHSEFEAHVLICSKL